MNVYTCDHKYEDWISAKSPAEAVEYDIRDPPVDTVIATYAYSGPPVAACGIPVVTIAKADGSNLAFLTTQFDANLR